MKFLGIRSGWPEAGPLGPNGLERSSSQASPFRPRPEWARSGPNGLEAGPNGLEAGPNGLGHARPEWARIHLLPCQAQFFRSEYRFFHVEEAIV